MAYLFITDSLDLPTGVGNVSRDIVEFSDEEWIVVGGNVNGAKGEYKEYFGGRVKEYQVENYGSLSLYETILQEYDITATLFMGESRFMKPVFEAERILKEHGPLLWYYVHETDSYPKLDKWKFETPDHIISASTVTQKMLDIGNHDNTWVPHGVNTDLFTPDGDSFKSELSLKEEDIAVLFVGKNQQRKNIPHIFQNFLQSKYRRIPSKYKIILRTEPVGELNIPRYLKNRYGRCALDRVTFVNELPREEMPKLYRSADILVNPSCREGFGLTPLEAVACGTNAFVTLTGGMKDYAFDHRDVYYYEPNPFPNQAVVDNTGSFSTAKYPKDSLNKSIKENSKSGVKDRFTARRMSEDIVQIIKNFENNQPTPITEYKI